MIKRALFPAEFPSGSNGLKLSPGIISGDHVFLTGMTGSDAQGQMSDEPEAQFRNAFDKIGHVLREAGLGFASVVEMTSYHIGLRDHFDLFCAVRGAYVAEPYPAWTAVEVAGLRREGALIEIRVIAAMEEVTGAGV